MNLAAFKPEALDQAFFESTLEKIEIFFSGLKNFKVF